MNEEIQKLFDDTQGVLELVQKLIACCKMLPLDYFHNKKDYLDAADFSDHANDFIEAMESIREILIELGEMEEGDENRNA